MGKTGAAFSDYRSYSRYVRSALQAWNQQVEWAPKDLRNALPTFAVMEGIHSAVWEQYIGHAPATVTERHYIPRLAARTRGEEETLQKRMELFRRHVVEPLEKAMKQNQPASEAPTLAPPFLEAQR